jgi:hypothetical protein
VVLYEVSIVVVILVLRLIVARLTAVGIRREVVVVLTKRLRSKGLSLGKSWRITLMVVKSQRGVEGREARQPSCEDWILVEDLEDLGRVLV